MNITTEEISNLIDEHKLINWFFSLLLIILSLTNTDLNKSYRERLLDGAFILIPTSNLSHRNTTNKKK